MLATIAAFEVGNVAAALIILRANELSAAEHGIAEATRIAIMLHTGYNMAATVVSVPPGGLPIGSAPAVWLRS